MCKCMHTTCYSLTYSPTCRRRLSAIIGEQMRTVLRCSSRRGDNQPARPSSAAQANCAAEPPWGGDEPPAAAERERGHEPPVEAVAMFERSEAISSISLPSPHASCTTTATTATTTTHPSELAPSRGLTPSASSRRLGSRRRSLEPAPAPAQSAEAQMQSRMPSQSAESNATSPPTGCPRDSRDCGTPPYLSESPPRTPRSMAVAGAACGYRLGSWRLGSWRLGSVPARVSR